MNTRLFLTSATSALALLLASCTSTIPDAAQMDRYYEKATEMAQKQIVLVNGQKERGEITQEEYDAKMAAINAGISKQAGDLAWARHELAESQMRAQGIPTGDNPIRVDPPARGGSDSFYRPYGEAAAGLYGSGTSASGSALNQRQGQEGSTLWRGYTPGSAAVQAGQRGMGSY